jgi:hypothetical protein
MSGRRGSGNAYQGRRARWTRSEQISLVAAAISLAALLVAAIQPVTSWINYLSRPKVNIQYPSDGMQAANNTFGAHGTAQDIPPSSDLWLVVRSGVEGRWYPVTHLTVSGGRWSIGRDGICPASGLQDIQIYLVPDTDEGGLFGYVRASKSQQALGMNSMPPGAVLEATHAVNVDSNSPTTC